MEGMQSVPNSSSASLLLLSQQCAASSFQRPSQFPSQTPSTFWAAEHLVQQQVSAISNIEGLGAGFGLHAGPRNELGCLGDAAGSPQLPQSAYQASAATTTQSAQNRHHHQQRLLRHSLLGPRSTQPYPPPLLPGFRSIESEGSRCSSSQSPSIMGTAGGQSSSAGLTTPQTGVKGLVGSEGTGWEVDRMMGFNQRVQQTERQWPVLQLHQEQRQNEDKLLMLTQTSQQQWHHQFPLLDTPLLHRVDSASRKVLKDIASFQQSPSSPAAGVPSSPSQPAQLQQQVLSLGSWPREGAPMHTLSLLYDVSSTSQQPLERHEQQLGLPARSGGISHQYYSRAIQLPQHKCWQQYDRDQGGVIVLQPQQQDINGGSCILPPPQLQLPLCRHQPRQPSRMGSDGSPTMSAAAMAASVQRQQQGHSSTTQLLMAAPLPQHEQQQDWQGLKRQPLRLQLQQPERAVQLTSDLQTSSGFSPTPKNATTAATLAMLAAAEHVSHGGCGGGFDHGISSDATTTSCSIGLEATALDKQPGGHQQQQLQQVGVRMAAGSLQSPRWNLSTTACVAQQQHEQQEQQQEEQQQQQECRTIRNSSAEVEEGNHEEELETGGPTLSFLSKLAMRRVRGAAAGRMASVPGKESVPTRVTRGSTTPRYRDRRRERLLALEKRVKEQSEVIQELQCRLKQLQDETGVAELENSNHHYSTAGGTSSGIINKTTAMVEAAVHSNGPTVSDQPCAGCDDHKETEGTADGMLS